MMIKFENTEVMGWDAAIRGMRNPMNSWETSDTDWFHVADEEDAKTYLEYDEKNDLYHLIGHNDLELMLKLRDAGTDHRKFMRMITVYVDITAPLYWWKEFDTYKVGTVASSCSTMHKIHEKKFTLEDFSCEHFVGECGIDLFVDSATTVHFEYSDVLYLTVKALNEARQQYIETGEKCYWWQMIQLLPSSYNQKRTVMLNYEVLANIYKSRKSHKLDDWSVGFMEWIDGLPYSELITGGINET